MKQVKKIFAIMLSMCLAISMMFSAVSVNAARKPKVPATKLTKEYKSSFCVGDEAVIRMEYLKGSASALKWNISNTNVGSILYSGKYKRNGYECMYIAIRCNKAGTSKVTAIDKGKKYTCSIRVKPLKLNYTQKTIKRGQKFTLKAINASKVSEVHFSLSGYNDFDDMPSKSDNIVYCKPGKNNNQVVVVGKNKGTTYISVGTSGSSIHKICKVTVK